MANVETLQSLVQEKFSDTMTETKIALGELTVEIKAKHLRDVCLTLRNDEQFKFEQLMDVCGVDYLHYGITEWQTDSTTLTGFGRGVDESMTRQKIDWEKPRFAVVYHLLSITHNHRIRLKVFLADEPPMVDSVVDVWDSANWFEREAFDLFGILFNGHPDLRRILTDYGFVGHPFRKDFPISGHVAMRYDEKLERCVYEPVQVRPRVGVPKVIRQDSRYVNPDEEKTHG